ncbi:uncharacterized protein RBU33_026251 [Hipposideros larvatus]
MKDGKASRGGFMQMESQSSQSRVTSMTGLEQCVNSTILRSGLDRAMTLTVHTKGSDSHTKCLLRMPGHSAPNLQRSHSVNEPSSRRRLQTHPITTGLGRRKKIFAKEDKK